jgi:hypothetical protein
MVRQNKILDRVLYNGSNPPDFSPSTRVFIAPGKVSGKKQKAAGRNSGSGEKEAGCWRRTVSSAQNKDCAGMGVPGATAI